METLKQLPDIQGRKFGTVSVGYDRIDKIRMEVSTLESLAALVLGCDREALTLEKISALITDVQIRAAALTDEEKAEWRDEDPRKLLAIAASKMA